MTKMYEALKEQFREVFGTAPAFLFSAPGRTELCGNHTDHQGGMVLAAAVNLETAAAVRPREDARIRLKSEGYPMCEVSLDVLEPVEEEKGTTASLIRGVAGGFAERGFRPVGFDACVCSSVLTGSGLSSSAAFEVLLGTVENYLTGADLPALEIARIGQGAENRYYGKPSGLLDQAAAASGGVVWLDFAPGCETASESIDVDFEKFGYALVVIDSGADHADLTADYAAIPGELGEVSAFFGRKVLREVPEEEFYRQLPEVRKASCDRAVLRAMHIYDENRRVQLARAALKRGDMEDFLRQLKASGRSSQLLLQNIIASGATREQALSYALACAERILDGEGASRVQGGGFAGTIQAFVPLDRLEGFCAEMDRLLGARSCHVLSVRPQGGVLLEVIA
ncbi:MAG: galactokinase [Oscillospiraceae bacterium]|nr:galactokinase [Oscillospiraceae bacterium]